MHKKFLYRIMICTTLAMASGTVHTMMLVTECCKKRELKPEKLEFKTARDLPRVTKFDYRGLGFIAGCVQQYFGVSAILSAKNLPVFMASFGQYPGSMMLAFCMYGYYDDVIKGLCTKKDDAIGVVFNQAYPPQICEEFHERDLRRKEFQENYKKMRAGSLALDPCVVAAHNTVIERCIKRRSFFQGYGFGVALGFPSVVMLLACMHEGTQK